MTRIATAAPGTLVGMERDIDRILISTERIAERIETLGEQIQADLAELPGDVEVIIVPILTGSIIFVADLIRQLPQKIRIAVVAASSYAGKRTQTTGDPLIGEIQHDLRDKFVLIVDDILDSGTTIRRIREHIEERGPRTLRSCVLLRKNRPSAMETPCEYIGFDIPDEFVVGYGLDYDDYYRNLPHIGVLKPEAL